MEEIVFYTTDEEKQAALILANSQDKRMVHDDHNVGPNGEHRLTLDASLNNSREFSPDPLLMRLEVIEARLAALGVPELT